MHTAFATMAKRNDMMELIAALLRALNVLAAQGSVGAHLSATQQSVGTWCKSLVRFNTERNWQTYVTVQRLEMVPPSARF